MMADINEIITGLEEAADFFHRRYLKKDGYKSITALNYQGVIEDAIKLLREGTKSVENHCPECGSKKELEPVKVIIHDEDEWYGFYAECPECGCEWMMDHEKLKYCPHCGKRVKWE